MRISEKGIDFIKQKEGCSLKVYLDVGGKPTIGVGHLIIKGESIPSEITDEQAEELLRVDLKVAEDAINRHVKVPLDQDQFDALCSLIFNIGVGAFIRSTLLKELNKNNILKAASEFLRWVYVGKKISPGLVARRKDEVALFIS